MKRMHGSLPITYINAIDLKPYSDFENDCGLEIPNGTYAIYLVDVSENTTKSFTVGMRGTSALNIEQSIANVMTSCTTYSASDNRYSYAQFELYGESWSGSLVLVVAMGNYIRISLAQDV